MHWSRPRVSPVAGPDFASTGCAAGRDMDRFGNIVTAVLNIEDEPGAAVTDAKRYLDLYYGANYSVERLHAWGPPGTPSHCAAWIWRFLANWLRRLHVPSCHHGRRDGATAAVDGGGSAVGLGGLTGCERRSAGARHSHAMANLAMI